MNKLFQALLLSSLLAAPAAAAELPRSESIDQWVKQERFTEAAVELERLAMSGEPADEAVLRRTIDAARDRLSAGDAEVRKAARRALCLARAHFPTESLPRIVGEAEEPLRVKDKVQRPQIISSLKPQYTPEAREQRIMGVVIVESVIDREGCVRNLNVLKGLPSGLSEAAVAAVRHWTFEPATLDDEPVNVYYVLTINFQLDSSEKKEG